jgi:hypothetical protein
VRAELRYRQREWAEKHGGGVIEARHRLGRLPGGRAQGVPHRVRGRAGGPPPPGGPSSTTSRPGR